MKEEQIIQKFYHKNKIATDDCAFLPGGVLVSTDTIAEGTHFLHSWSSPEDLAIKLVEVNASDIYSSGGKPQFAFLNLGLSKTAAKADWIEIFSKSILKQLRFHKTKLVGGDTYYSKTTNLSLTLIGKTRKPILRSGGKPEDFLYVTGDLGLSLLGYKSLKNKIKLPVRLKKLAMQKHLRPKSRKDLAPKLIQKEIHASMDITDGLIQDSLKLARASKLNLTIEIEKVPGILKYSNFLSVEEVLSSGEELEFLILSDKEIEDDLITKIGYARNKNKVGVDFIFWGKEFSPKKKGFEHFS